MSRYVGDQNKVLFLIESGLYASSSGVGQWFGLVKNNELDESTNVQEVRYAGTASRDVSVFVPTALDVKGKIKYFLQDFRMIPYALGSSVDAGASPYTHTTTASNSNNGNAFTSGTSNPFLSFTVEDSQTANVAGLNNVRTAVGCTIDTLELSSSEGQLIEANVDYIAQAVNFSSGAATAVTAATTRPLMWSDVKIHLPSGTVINEVRDWSLKFENKLDPPHYNNGSRVIDAPIPTDRKVSLDFTADATSERWKTWYTQYYKGGSTFNVLFEVSAAEAGAGSRNYFVTMSGCSFENLDDPSLNTGVNKAKANIVAASTSAIAQDLIAKYNPW